MLFSSRANMVTPHNIMQVMPCHLSIPLTRVILPLAILLVCQCQSTTRFQTTIRPLLLFNSRQHRWLSRQWWQGVCVCVCVRVFTRTCMLLWHCEVHTRTHWYLLSSLFSEITPTTFFTVLFVSFAPGIYLSGWLSVVSMAANRLALCSWNFAINLHHNTLPVYFTSVHFVLLLSTNTLTMCIRTCIYCHCYSLTT